MTSATQRPWLSLYPPGADPDLSAPQASLLERFLHSADDDPGAPAIHYFGRTISRGELADLSARAAVVLRRAGVQPDDRVALSLQNTPLFVATMLGAWGLGASVVPVNPMLRPGELTPMLADSAASVLVAHPAMSEVIDEVGLRLGRPLTCLWSESSDLAGEMALPFSTDAAAAPESLAGQMLLAECEHADVGGFDWSLPSSDDVALFTYTSGTTGPSKGAVGTHGNVSYQADNFGQWISCDETDSVLSIAPLFHITGIGGHLALALGNCLPLVLTYRFEPGTVLGLIERYRPTYTVGAITAYIAMLEHDPGSGATLGSIPKLMSGGAPVPSHVVERFEEATGRYLHNAYGLTEMTSACICVPLGVRAPVDKGSGALSIGVPMGGTDVTLIGDDGHPVPFGSEGEIVVRGPQSAAGYWNRVDETAATFRPEGVYTGDIGVMDEDGWIYIVDRKKDLVIVSGYKVWPRDVEDVLYRHPAVKEAAVVGKPDSYRGETLHAFVSLRAGESTTAAELRAWCRDNLSAYKVPAEYSFVNDLPKTTTGKILRRSLRD